MSECTCNSAYSFLGLAFVGADLVLQFVNQVLQALLVLPVFVNLRAQTNMTSHIQTF